MVQALASDINLLAAIGMQKDIEDSKLDAKLFMLVHDSIVGLVRTDQLEVYKQLLAKNTQKDRGFSIAGCPIGIDQSEGLDYSFGSFDEKWGEEYARFIKDPVAYIPA
jgi:DNA polymerase I-like protein with 3'-5' exonuclease and polymerase domains